MDHRTEYASLAPGEQKDEENELKLLLKRRISSRQFTSDFSFDLPRCLIDRGGNPAFGKFLKFSN